MTSDIKNNQTKETIKILLYMNKNLHFFFIRNEKIGVL